MFSLTCILTKNNVEFLPIENSSKKVSGNNVDFSTREVTLKALRGKDVDFSISEITLKISMCVEMTWKFVEIWSSTYRRNIGVKSTSIRRGVLLGSNSIVKSFFLIINIDLTKKEEQLVQYS